MALPKADKLRARLGVLCCSPQLLPSLLVADALAPVPNQLLRAAAACLPQYVPPLALDGRAASMSSAGGGGALPGVASGGALQGMPSAPGLPGQQVMVGSFPAAIPTPSPPAMQTITTADAMATEGRIIEDAAMHEQYVRVITPEPAPTEETEEVRGCLWPPAPAAGWAGWHCKQASNVDHLSRASAPAQQGSSSCGRRAWAGGLLRLALACSAHSACCPRCARCTQVCYLLRQCLDMRSRWLFRPALSPEQLADLPEAVTVTDVQGDPFAWQPQASLLSLGREQTGSVWAWVWVGVWVGEARCMASVPAVGCQAWSLG